MSMKATDLRTGNLILRVGNVSEVNWSTIKLCEQRNKQFNEDFKPIPLSPEWLQRFNAIFPYGDKRCQIGNLCFYWNPHDVLFLNDSGYNESISDTPIMYVHTLQNVFHSLTGQELILKP